MKFLVIFVALCVSNTSAVMSFGDSKVEDAKVGQFKYIALIKLKHPHTGNYMPICAGAIITEHDILTNAVCASACQYPPNCKVYVGRIHVNSGGREVTIKGTVWHKSYYEMETMKNISSVEDIFDIIDIGIIHTEKISMSETVGTVPMNRRGVTGKLTMVMAGWGAETDLNFRIQPRVNRILPSSLFAL